METQNLSMVTDSFKSGTTSIQESAPSEDSVILVYDTIPANHPSEYGNFVAIWQSPDSTIPWGTEPIETAQVPGDTPHGSLPFEVDLQNKTYVVGYSVGPVLKTKDAQTYGNICATVFLPVVGEPLAAPFSPSLALLSSTTDVAKFSFRLPEGFTPVSNGSWVGIWRGGKVDYKKPADMGAAFTKDFDSGSVFVTGSFLRKTTYTAALFTSGFVKAAGPNNQLPMAAWCTFTTAG